MRTGILIGIATVAVLVGGFLLFTTALGLPFAGGYYGLVLAMYDRNGDAMQQPARIKELYAFTKRVVHQRIHYQLAFDYTLGTASFLVGLLLTAWTIDRERLRHRIRDLAQAHPSLHGDGSPARIPQEN